MAREKILIVDDEPLNLELLERELTAHDYTVESARDGEEALKKADSFLPDLIFLDYMMPDMSGLEVLKEIRSKGNDVPVVMITAYGTIERAVEAMKEGACDFITKPFDADHVVIVIKKALERQRLEKKVEIFAAEISQRHQLVTGASVKMNQVLEAAKRVSASKSTVLLLGESGTGKELLARAIHNWSDRREQPFIAINCVGLSKELLESELFGHEKGAFTGAHELKKGKIELAHGGTVLLDEVGDISPEVQTKLLRFLQEREFERVGGTRAIPVDVRIIAATSRDLDRAVKEGLFREDLYYRLNVVPIVLPPLRERREDIVPLARHFLRRFSSETKKNFTEIDKEAQQRLLEHNWPGNVRELANALERAVVMGQRPKLTPEDLPPKIMATRTGARHDGISYRKVMEDYRREVILRALNGAGGNRAAAAKALGLNRSHLSRLIKILRIE